jgi:O-antigen/teichoic acid export membrane protein
MKVFAVISLISTAFIPQYIIRRREKEAISQIPSKPIAWTFAVASLLFVLLTIAHTIFLFLGTYPNISFIFSTSIGLPYNLQG